MIPFELLMMFKRNADVQAKILVGLPSPFQPHNKIVMVADNNQFSLQGLMKIETSLNPVDQLSGIQASMFDFNQNGYV